MATGIFAIILGWLSMFNPSILLPALGLALSGNVYVKAKKQQSDTETVNTSEPSQNYEPKQLITLSIVGLISNLIAVIIYVAQRYT